MKQARVPKRPVHGVLLLDKPLTWSSNDALQKVKRLFRAEKAGHTGTLDPLATGLLPLCFGAATKFSQVSLDADKTYRATIKLGETRVGGDLEGDVIESRPVNCDETQLRAACAKFIGTIRQTPPMHSALKHEGRALYEYASQGIEIEREPREVTIHSIDGIEGQHDTWTIDVCCSKGTYIRTLAQDIGQALGCGAHLQALRRTACGPLTVSDAVTIDALTAMSEEQRDARLLRPDALLQDWPTRQLDADDAARFLCGLRRRVDAHDKVKLRVYGPGGPGAGEFLGTAHIKSGDLIPVRLLSPVEVRSFQS